MSLDGVRGRVWFKAPQRIASHKIRMRLCECFEALNLVAAMPHVMSV